MLYGVSLRYKESANVRSARSIRLCHVCFAGTYNSDAPMYTLRPQCRLEANYAHQQELDMIPLMMQKDYAPKGWRKIVLVQRVAFATLPCSAQSVATVVSLICDGSTCSWADHGDSSLVRDVGRERRR